MNIFDNAWAVLKNLDDEYADGTSPELYGFSENVKGSFHDYMDDMIRQGFKERGLDPRHFNEWMGYDESVGSEIEGTEIPGGLDRHEYTDEGWEARLALSEILADLAEQHREIGPEGDWRKVQPSIVADDPFRMKKPDIQTELEDMAAETARREGRKKLKNLFNEDGTGKPEFDKYGAMHRDRELPVFDQENPHNERLTGVTQPQMDRRTAKLRAEMARRGAKKDI